MHPKITHFKLYMLAHGDPFVALSRGSGDNTIVRFYTLYKATAWRLAEVSRMFRGNHSVDGQGWSWTRA